MRRIAVLLTLAAVAASSSAVGEPIVTSQDDGYRGIWYANQSTGEEYAYKYSGGLGTYCAKHQPFAEHAQSTEHRADRHAAKRRKLFLEILAKAGAQWVVSGSGAAGFRLTDSPQPHSDTWFGLSKTKPDENLVVRWSMTLPSRNNTALEST